jgi:3D-(3,5/4)-trihydroxycyclohexane-1,2-dione acylhydrolase (decyclizing)
VDFAAHARALGAEVFTPADLVELSSALEAAREIPRTTVIVVPVRESDWTEGGAFWQVGVPEVSDMESVRSARAAMDDGLLQQRRGV